MIGAGGEADPLYGYLASQILSRLHREERRFLENTSLLGEVTAARAQALGQRGAGELLVRLRATHLPVAWLPDGMTMRCHPRFREYLAERLRRRGGAEVARLQLAYGELLIAEGMHEEATEHFLSLRDAQRALHAAERVIERVVARLDVAVAERWLAALDEPESGSGTRLAAGELMLAIARRLQPRWPGRRPACCSGRARGAGAPLADRGEHDVVVLLAPGPDLRRSRGDRRR